MMEYMNQSLLYILGVVFFALIVFIILAGAAAIAYIFWIGYRKQSRIADSYRTIDMVEKLVRKHDASNDSTAGKP